jgi:hypothetical protein
VSTVPSGEIRTKRDLITDFPAVCGTCGAMVATEHVARHIAWHNTPHTSAQVVANAVSSSIPGGNG